MPADQTTKCPGCGRASGFTHAPDCPTKPAPAPAPLASSPSEPHPVDDMRALDEFFRTHAPDADEFTRLIQMTARLYNRDYPSPTSPEGATTTGRCTRADCLAPAGHCADDPGMGYAMCRRFAMGGARTNRCLGCNGTGRAVDGPHSSCEGRGWYPSRPASAPPEGAVICPECQQVPSRANSCWMCKRYAKDAPPEGAEGLDELEALARDAMERHREWFDAEDAHNGAVSDGDAAFIAACSPAVILALIADRTTLTARVREVEEDGGKDAQIRYLRGKLDTAEANEAQLWERLQHAEACVARLEEEREALTKLDTGADVTWTTQDQDEAAALTHSLNVLTSFTGTIDGKRHHADRVRALFKLVTARLTEARAGGERDLARAFLAGVEHVAGAEGCGAREGQAAAEYVAALSETRPTAAGGDDHA